MKLLDKIKDLFMDEVSEEEDMELSTDLSMYEEPKDVLPKVMRDTISKEEKKNLKKEEEEVKLKVKPEEFIKQESKENVSEKNVPPVKKFNFPIDFEEELPKSHRTQTVNKNILKVEKEASKKVSELYSKKEEVKVKPKFKASPVISPVYGVLDKNYTKEEVKEKSEDKLEMKRPSKKVDFETVRKKAFGNLADDIKDNLMCENCELYKEVKKISALKEDDLLYDMTVDDVKDVTIEKAYDNYEEFGVAYEPKTTRVEEKEVKKEDIPTRESLKKEEVVEEIPTRSRNINEEEKKDSKVDADFFELIDSMYKDRSDD